MPVLDWSGTAAWIALIVAIISPFATTILTNRYNLKIKKMELFQIRKIGVIESYLKAASNAAYTNGIPNDFAEMSAVIFLYAPPELHKKIRELNKVLEHGSFVPDVITLLEDVSIALRNETQIS